MIKLAVGLLYDTDCHNLATISGKKKTQNKSNANVIAL